jgi:hypothetical protein
VQTNPIRVRTVSLIARIIKPWVDEGIVTVAENREILANIRHLSQRGMLIPAMQPKFLNQQEVADMLSISLSSFKKQERAGDIQIPRRMVGTSVRYLNTDVLEFMMLADDEETEEDK